MMRKTLPRTPVLWVFSMIAVVGLALPLSLAWAQSADDPSAAPKVVPVIMLEQDKVGTNEQPHLPVALKILHPCEVLSGTYKLCLSQSGNVSSVEVLSSIPGADRAIVQTLKSWRYRPQSKPVCFVRSFDFEVEGDTACLNSEDYHPVPAQLVAAAPIHDASACAAVIKGMADGRVGKVAFRIELDAQGKIHKLSSLESQSLALDLYVASLLRYNPKCKMKPAVDKAGKPVPFVLERYQISLE